MKNKYALVLAGGGTKGAYQIGVRLMEQLLLKVI